MAGVFSFLFLVVLGVFGWTFFKSKKSSKIRKALLFIFGFILLVFIYKFGVEELYPCWAFGGMYCDFATSSYHSPLFPF